MDRILAARTTESTPDEPMEPLERHEELLEAFLEALGRGEPADARRVAEELDDPSVRERFVGTALAHELLFRIARGEAVRPADHATRLVSFRERGAFDQVLASNERARRALPVVRVPEG